MTDKNEFEDKHEIIDGWYVIGDIYFKFESVSPFMYDTLDKHIQIKLEKSKPIAPIIQQGSVSRKNEADATFQAEMRIWNSVKRITEDISAADISIAAGIVLKDPVPDESLWLPNIERQLKVFNVSLEDVNMPYMPSEAQIEFLYKKYVVLKSDMAMTLFKMFFDKDTKKAITTIASAVSMFRDDQKQPPDGQSTVK